MQALGRMRELLEAVDAATGRVVDAVDGADLRAPSGLPGWSRLTIACHLRYGAEALRAMTADAIEGRPASYYPQGRASGRPATLAPRDGESDAEVVAALRAASAALAATWGAVEEWSVEVTEPADNPDLGTVPLAHLPLFRLTEVEVHGTDLDLGLPPWSDALVRHVLPMRLEWLNRRRTNHRAVDGAVQGAFLLRAPDVGVAQLVEVHGDVVRSSVARGDTRAGHTIEAAGRDLLALLLGRWDDGSEAVRAFGRAFPGP
jgi:maleylpyruvate isomerase